jgi:hypothetical protein
MASNRAGANTLPPFCPPQLPLPLPLPLPLALVGALSVSADTSCSDLPGRAHYIKAPTLFCSKTAIHELVQAVRNAWAAVGRAGTCARRPTSG